MSCPPAAGQDGGLGEVSQWWCCWAHQLSHVLPLTECQSPFTLPLGLCRAAFCAGEICLCLEPEMQPL